MRSADVVDRRLGLVHGDVSDTSRHDRRSNRSEVQMIKLACDGDRALRVRDRKRNERQGDDGKPHKQSLLGAGGSPMLRAPSRGAQAANGNETLVVGCAKRDVHDSYTVNLPSSRTPCVAPSFSVSSRWPPPTANLPAQSARSPRTT